jgi:hypothetical protein
MKYFFVKDFFLIKCKNINHMLHHFIICQGVDTGKKWVVFAK